MICTEPFRPDPVIFFDTLLARLRRGDLIPLSALHQEALEHGVPPLALGIGIARCGGVLARERLLTLVRRGESRTLGDLRRECHIAELDP